MGMPIIEQPQQQVQQVVVEEGYWLWQHVDPVMLAGAIVTAVVGVAAWSAKSWISYHFNAKLEILKSRLASR